MAVTIATLASQAEAAIRRLRDIEGVSVRTEGEDIREIHVLTSSERPPKNIVRDIQTVLKTRLGVGIDHRVVSVALAQKGEVEAMDFSQPDPAPDHEAASAARGLEADLETEPVATDERIRFEGVNLFVSGPRTQAQVELRWKGLPRMGNASGWSTRDESHRLVAQATATAVQEFLADPVALGVQGVEFVETGRHKVVVVTLSMLVHRHEKVLTGCAVVEQDTPQSVVLATLSALNRVVGGMRVKEPTEYVLRATAHP